MPGSVPLNEAGGFGGSALHALHIGVPLLLLLPGLLHYRQLAVLGERTPRMGGS